MDFYLGTQGWSYKEWVGPLYPPHTGAKDYLRHYARNFNAVELDSTFYGTPPARRVQGWADATPEEFVFTAKVPKLITHDMRLVEADAPFEEFVNVMRALQPKLRAILIQLPPDMTIDEHASVEAFLEGLPEEIDFAIEFRHRSWLRSEIFDMLRDRAVAWTTSVALPYMTEHVEITAPFAYIRWLGDHRGITRLNETQIDNQAELDGWVVRLQEIAQRVQRVYGFANNHYSGHSPNDISYLQSRLGVAPPTPTTPEQATLL